MVRLILIALIVLSLSFSAFGDEFKLLPGEVLPELKDVSIETVVFYDDASDSYFYSYEVSNSRTSTGAISSIEIDITLPEESLNPNGEGLTYGQGYIGGVNASIVTVGLSAPSGWIAATSVRGTAAWGGTDEQYFIEPNSAVSDFEINSRGLPGIRRVYIMPHFRQTPVEDPTKEDVERIRAIKEYIVFETKAVGPTAPPKELDAAEFVQNMIDMEHEAFDMGWITNKGIERSLDAKLDAAKRNLESGRQKAASNILRAFINEVEAQGCPTYDDCPKGKHLMPEAYSLLKHNAQYLLDNLAK